MKTQYQNQVSYLQKQFNYHQISTKQPPARQRVSFECGGNHHSALPCTSATKIAFFFYSHSCPGSVAPAGMELQPPLCLHVEIHCCTPSVAGGRRQCVQCTLIVQEKKIVKYG